MSALRRTWQALVRPRSLGWRHSGGRRAQRGVALLVVITTVMVMTVVVTDLAYGARVRFLVAAHSRDRAQAYWLAKSGVGLYQLILAANKEIGSNSMIQDLGLGDSLWQMVPVINTGLMRMLLAGGGDLGDFEEEEMEEFAATGKVDEEVAEETRTTGLFDDRNFLDFAGDFSAEITDQESKINVNLLATCGEETPLNECATAMLLHTLMSGEDNDQWFYDKNIDRWEIIGNLKDWVDADTMRSGPTGGYEDNLYNTLPDPYLTKNAKLDTIDEIRLVEGWQDDVFDKFGDKLTIYGSGGKININSPNLSSEMLATLIRACSESPPTDAELDRVMDDIELQMSITTINKWSEFAESLENTYGWPMKDTCPVTNTSTTFTVTSTGLVADSSVTIITVLDYSSSSIGSQLYWRVD